MLPSVVAGIGKTTTDFTGIAAPPCYRLVVGIAHHLTDKFGFRLEARDEIISKLASSGSPPVTSQVSFAELLTDFGYTLKPCHFAGFGMVADSGLICPIRRIC
jgi:hypothetical protein